MIIFLFLHCRLDDKYVIQCKKNQSKGMITNFNTNFLLV